MINTEESFSQKQFLPVILKLSCDIDENLSVSGILMPGRKATLLLGDLNESGTILSLKTSEGTMFLQNFQTEQNGRNITFTVPIHVREGNLSLRTANIRSDFPYRIWQDGTPYLIDVSPRTVPAGETVTLRSEHISDGPVTVVFS